MNRQPDNESSPSPESRLGFQQKLHQARDGDDSIMGQLLQQYRDYLLMIANREVDPAVQNKVAPSDIVQESLLTAHQEFAQFVGKSEGELRAWLRQILINDVYQAGRKFRAKKRAVDRERPIVFTSSLDRGIADVANTPRTDALANEEAQTLQKAMEQLSGEHQEVIRLRNWQDLSFAEIGEQMDRSPDAARKLWSRAIMNLQSRLGQSDREADSNE